MSVAHETEEKKKHMDTVPFSLYTRMNNKQRERAIELTPARGKLRADGAGVTHSTCVTRILFKRTVHGARIDVINIKYRIRCCRLFGRGRTIQFLGRLVTR